MTRFEKLLVGMLVVLSASIFSVSAQEEVQALDPAQELSAPVSLENAQPIEDAPRDIFKEAPWTFSFGVGWLNLEGDEPVKDGPCLSLKSGYDFSPHWAFEADFALFPNLEHNTFEDDRFHIDDDIWAVHLGLDMLFHFRSTKDLHFDPYLAGGAATTGRRLRAPRRNSTAYSRSVRFTASARGSRWNTASPAARSTATATA